MACMHGVQILLTSQTEHGGIRPELYRSGSIAMALGVEAGCVLPSHANAQLLRLVSSVSC